MVPRIARLRSSRADLPAFSHSSPSPDHSKAPLSPNGHSGLPLRVSSPVVVLALASVVAAGVQFGWALQLSLLSPYIQTLGIGHDFLSFVWLCGPITGLVVQPCVGVWSDKCKLRLGRRRPFILAGSLLICLAVIIIGFAADIGSLLGDSQEDCMVTKVIRPRAVVVFIFGFWLLDLANNTAQGPARALLADLAGSEQRDTANAIFCLWMAVGNILGYSAGASGDWPSLFPHLTTRACCEACGNLKAAFLVAVVFLIFCTLVTLFFAKETPLMVAKGLNLEDASPLLPLPDQTSVELQAMGIPSDTRQEPAGVEHNGNVDLLSEEVADSVGVRPDAILVNLLTSVRHLPPEMRSVLLVMALCWLSWFPFFLYDTDWMGREVFQGDPFGDHSKSDAYQKGVQMGAYGLLLNSVVLAIGSFFIDPLCRRFGSKYVWAASNFMIFVCMASTAFVNALAAAKKTDTGAEDVSSYANWAEIAALALFALLGLPLAVTYSVPYSITAELATDSGRQGLAMGILNLAVVIPQMVVALGAGPWDRIFGSGNEPAFVFAGVFAFSAGVVAVIKLPKLAKGGYKPAGAGGHGFV